MTRTALGALLSHWRRRPLQLLTLIAGLALATALWSGVQAINAEARASYDRAAEALGETTLAQIVAEGRDSFAQERFVALRRAGWLVSPVVDGERRIAGRMVRIVGFDPLTAPQGSAAPDLTGLDDPTAFLTPPGLILAAPATVSQLGDAADLPPLRSVDGLAPGLLVADIGIAQRLLGLDGQVTRLLVAPEQPVTQMLLKDVAPDLTLRPPRTQSDLARLTDSFHLNLTAFGLLSFAVGLFIVNATIGLAFEQRRPVFRTLRALGLPLSTLIRLLLVELLVLATLAGLAGVALGYVIAAALLPDVAATLRGLYGATVSSSLELRPAWWGAGLAIAVAGTGLAAAGSLWQVARMPLLAPAQPRAWAMASARWRRGQLAAAGAFALAALAAGLFGQGLVAGFVMLGAMLLAAALLLPPVLATLLALAARGAKGPVAQWFWADTRQQLPGLSLALMALLLALAANIGVGTMVSSFRLTFTGWLDQRLASELYVRVEDAAQAAALRSWAAGNAEAILPIWDIEGSVNGAPAEIFGVADHPTYRRHWPLLDALPDVWDRVADGEVLINEQMARRDRIGPGDALTLPGGHAARIAGVYSDYGNPKGQVLVGIDRFSVLYPEADRLNFGLRLPETQIDAARAGLVAEVGLDPQRIVDQASLKALSLGIFEQTFKVTGALNVLTLSVAGFAILTSLLTLAAMRLPQLAPIWALGLTRRRLAGLELLRALMLAALTALLAVPVGLGLAWVLLAVINVEAFGWRLPMHLFPRDWFVLGGLALLAAALAAVFPARGLARTPPARLLQVFAHER